MEDTLTIKLMYANTSSDLAFLSNIQGTSVYLRLRHKLMPDILEHYAETDGPISINKTTLTVAQPSGSFARFEYFINLNAKNLQSHAKSMFQTSKGCSDSKRKQPFISKKMRTANE